MNMALSFSTRDALCDRTLDRIHFDYVSIVRIDYVEAFYFASEKGGSKERMPN